LLKNKYLDIKKKDDDVYNLQIIFDYYYLNNKNYILNGSGSDHYISDDTLVRIDISSTNFEVRLKINLEYLVVMKFIEILKDKDLTNIYFKLLLFLNSNYEDRPSIINGDVVSYIEDYYNEYLNKGHFVFVREL
jgi:hypothetical protein